MSGKAKFAFSDGQNIEYDIEPRDIIYWIAKFSNCRTYLELGVYEGVTFEGIYTLVDRCIGVDKKDFRSRKIGEFYEETTAQFFSHFKDKVDIIFIDADHSYLSVLFDLEASLNILNKHGIIFLHDTDPCSKELIKEGFCSDAYKIHTFIENRDDLTYVTLPIISTGLTIITRKEDRRVLNFT